MFHLLLLLLHLKVVVPYSIFGGNTYGYTGGSVCAALNGCTSRDAEGDEGKPRDLFGSSGTQQTSEECVLEKDYNKDVPASIMEVRSDEFGIDFLDVKRELKKCFDKSVSKEETLERFCETLKGDKYLRKRFEEIFEYQILHDKSVLQNYQGAIWRWNLGNEFVQAKAEDRWSRMITDKCDQTCLDHLLFYCTDVYSIRHVKDWCNTIHSWIDTETMDQYQHGLLWLVRTLLLDQFIRGRDTMLPDQLVAALSNLWVNGVTSREEKAVLAAAAMSTVFLTKNLFDNLAELSVVQVNGKTFNMPRLGHVAMHSLFLANYAGRLRVTLHKKPEGWGAAGTLLQTTGRGINSARNFEGLTGSVYASLGALFNTKNNLGQSDDPDTTFAPLGVRFRLEVGEPNGIGCVEQTTGMIFIRPGDWISKDNKWKPIGPRHFSPSGVIAVDPWTKTSTLEINEGGLVMYPVTVGDVLRNHTQSMCNAKPGERENGNGPASQKGFNLKGIGGICNWVPTW